MNEIVSPLVSIVIPSYNHGHYLGRALQSVLDQTYANWEAIVIDNHSTDNTDEVMATFSDSRISYLKIHNNGVIAASRNLGIMAAKGRWIAFLDSDDWWTIDKLQTCFDHINDDVDFLYHDLEVVTEKPRFFRRKVIKSWQVKSPVLIDLLTNGNAIATSSVVVRAELLQQLNGMCEESGMVAAEDYNTWLRIAKLTNAFRYIPKRLGLYQVHKDGISRKNMSVPTSQALIRFVGDLNLHQSIMVDINLKYANLRYSFLKGDYLEAKKDLNFCILKGPLEIKCKCLYMMLMIIFYSYKST
jgi:glycosyltransferase involved in cell wall biosynthesis